MEKVLDDMKKCYGCTACLNICPADAIYMKVNEDGFTEPVIRSDKCIDCNACKKVCPVNKRVYGNNTSPKVFCMASDKETLYNSSSGGAFSLLAECFLSEGGYVAGAAFTDDFEVEHRIISDITELDDIRRSKYLQSDQGDTYSKVKHILESGGRVLYSGCPCQIAGLNNFLGKTYEGLVNIDVLCHGVPSKKYYREYVEEICGSDNVSSVEMRRRDGWGSHFKITKKNGDEICHVSNRDVFLKGFHNDLYNRDSCHGCAFSRLPRQGDITLGDFWPVKKLKIGEIYEKKSSICLLNTTKGEDLWNRSLEKTEKQISYKELTEKYGIEKFNSNIYEPSIKNDTVNKEIFKDKHKKTGFTEAVLKTLYDYNVGLILFMSDNYGSTATNYALYTAVEEMGYSPVILDNLCAIEGVSKNFAKGRLALSSKILEKDDRKSVNAMCESFILGSDQSLNWDFSITKKYMEYILMAFASDEKRKIAYAASLGKERYNVDPEIVKIYKHLLKRFTAVSVREDYAVNMCKKLFETDATHVIDPVFLIDKEKYINIAKESQIDFNEKYLLAYIRDPNERKRQLILEMSEYYGVKPVIVCDAFMYAKVKRILNTDAVIEKIEFIDWIAYYYNASYVITDSFHGTCFSVIFEKEFVSIKAGAKARFDSLEKILDSGTKRNAFIYNDVSELPGNDEVFHKRDFSEINKLIAREVTKSKKWLKDSLQADMSGCKTRTDTDILVDYTNVLRLRNSARDIVKKYGYHEYLETDIKRHIKSGKTFLEAVYLVHGINEYPKHDLVSVTDIKKYFTDIMGDINYYLCISCKDSCATYWDDLIKKTKLPLSLEPATHTSYVAIVNGERVLFEEASKDCIYKDHTITYRSISSGQAVIKAFHVMLVSQRYDTNKQFQKSEIRVNNLDYSMNKRGLNFVLIDVKQGGVVDSFYIDLHADGNMKIIRR